MDKRLYTLITTISKLVVGIVNAVMAYCAAKGYVSAKAVTITIGISSALLVALDDILLLFVPTVAKPKESK